MRVSEIFYSLQGEGFLAGVPSAFVRLAGCPLCCKWCDTKYAWDKEAGAIYSIEKIVEAVQQYRGKFMVITGGEPMINPDLPQLVRKLKALGKHITIETAGIAYIPEMPCDLMSISPKLSNSTPDETELAAIHEDSRLDLSVLRKLISSAQTDWQLQISTKICREFADRFAGDTADTKRNRKRRFGEGNVDAPGQDKG